MSEARTRIKRQIELLGLVVAEPCKYKIIDLELYFNCTQITIKRDLKELRSLGIDIHSVPQKGIRIDGKIDREVIKNLLADYIIASGNDSFYHRSLHFFADKHKEFAISNFTKIQISIENNFKIAIEYHKKNNFSTNKVIDPLLIFLNENEWRLLANDGGRIKQFLVSKINSVKILNEIYSEELRKEAHKIYEASFGNWISGECINVKLRFSKDWLASGKEPKMMEYQDIVNEKDGSKVISFKVNSLEEIARWIVGRGGEVIVLEPEDLRKIVMHLAKDTIESNKLR